MTIVLPNLGGEGHIRGHPIWVNIFSGHVPLFLLSFINSMHYLMGMPPRESLILRDMWSGLDYGLSIFYRSIQDEAIPLLL